MAIECYNTMCPFHSVHDGDGPNEGPVCYEFECHEAECRELMKVPDGRPISEDEWAAYAADRLERMAHDYAP